MNESKQRSLRLILHVLNKIDELRHLSPDGETTIETLSGQISAGHIKGNVFNMVLGRITSDGIASFRTRHGNSAAGWGSNPMTITVPDWDKFDNYREQISSDIRDNESTDHQSSASHRGLKKVFIVHGHDNEMKEAVARQLSDIGLKPVILHEQADKGLTLIEKFTDYSDVGFAVVLLSPDDLAYQAGEPADTALHQARQNVIFEMGFFIGKLGRDLVLTIHREDKAFIMPSDINGVLYTPYDQLGAWRHKLKKELSVAGLEVNANELSR